MTQTQDGWGSRVGLILAMAGNAVGLGNFLRFPVKAVQNGGGEFIIPYLVAFLLMGIPLLWVEWGMGRYGGGLGNHSTPFIMDTMGKKRMWKYIGVFGIFTNLGVIAYYTYIESWTLSYVFEYIQGTFSGMDRTAVAQHFDSYVDIQGAGEGVVNTPGTAIVFFLITLSINIWILSKGLSGGIEKVAKIAMPLLLVFGLFLAIKSWSLGSTGLCDTCSSHTALDFLWNPSAKGLGNFKTWLEAAGQVFFTLSVGMGTIHCYSSYLKKRDDVALNAMSAGFMNSFVEVVLGAAIVIPIAVGYFGMDWIMQDGNAGFMMAFKTMPFLFDQWGDILSILAGIAWFGLLFFAGITSSLAMGTPWMGFMKDEFGWSNKKSAFTFGLIVLLLALPPILFFQAGVFDEYDFWTGTVSLVIFALLEVYLFTWIFGIDNAWNEITTGSDIKIPKVFKFIMKYITPLFILIVFLGSLISPAGGDWQAAFSGLMDGNGWDLDKGSILSMIFHLNIDSSEYIYFKDGGVTNLFLIDMSRVLMFGVFIGIAVMVRRAAKKREMLK